MSQLLAIELTYFTSCMSLEFNQLKKPTSVVPIDTFVVHTFTALLNLVLREYATPLWLSSLLRGLIGIFSRTF